MNCRNSLPLLLVLVLCLSSLPAYSKETLIVGTAAFLKADEETMQEVGPANFRMNDNGRGVLHVPSMNRKFGVMFVASERLPDGRKMWVLMDDNRVMWSFIPVRAF